MQSCRRPALSQWDIFLSILLLGITMSGFNFFVLSGQINVLAAWIDHLLAWSRHARGFTALEVFLPVAVLNNTNKMKSQIIVRLHTHNVARVMTNNSHVTMRWWGLVVAAHVRTPKRHQGIGNWQWRPWRLHITPCTAQEVTPTIYLMCHTWWNSMLVRLLYVRLSMTRHLL